MFVDPEDVVEEAADELEWNLLALVAVVGVLVLAGVTLVAFSSGLLGGDSGSAAGDGATPTSEGTGTSRDTADGSATTRDTADGGGTTQRDALLRTSFEDPDALSSWTTSGRATRDGDEHRGNVTVAGDELRLQVYRCYQILAQRELGTHSGRIRVAFDWRSRAQQWWERPTWKLTDGNGNAYNYTVVSEHDLRRPPTDGSRSGRAVVEADVDGQVVVTFAIEPSQYCGRSNHRTTTLTVDDLVVTAQNEP